MWVKDREVSDSMTAAMDLLALGGIVRQAVKLIQGVQIQQDNTIWTMAVFSLISWFKVTERYALDGSPSQCRRRDLRGGKHTGALLPGRPGPHGGLVLSLEWPEPHEGTGTDEFVLAPRGTAAAQKKGQVQVLPAQDEGDKELHVYSIMKCNASATPCHYRTVYRRKGRHSPALAR